MKQKTAISRPVLPKLLPVLAGLLLTAGLLAAQEPTPAPVDCAPAAIAAQQAALAAALDTFAADLDQNTGAALEALFQTGAAYQELALACGYVPPDAAERPVGTDIARILNALEQTGLAGDPLNGQLLYNGSYACAGCHVSGAGTVAPHTEGTYTRVETTRLGEPQFADYTVRAYLIESIVDPEAYIVPNYKNAMPNDFGSRLSLQALADLLAFLESQDGDSPE
jgi:hypothetical protein